jgi:hypothetical protein
VLFKPVLAAIPQVGIENAAHSADNSIRSTATNVAFMVPTMSTVLVVAFSFVVGAIAGAVALLAFAASTAKDVEEIERRYRAAKDWKFGDELIGACG